MYGERVMNLRLLPLLALGLAACDQDYTVNPQPPDVDPMDITECGFTRVDATAYYRYDCNPVFTTTGEGWAETIGSTGFNVTEVMGHPMYQLWYTGLTDDGSSFPPYAMGYAASADGTTFTPFAENPVLAQSKGDAFDSHYMSGNQVVWDPSTAQYVMIWQGIHDATDPAKIVDALGVGTSPDGVKWTRYAKNPVFDLGLGGKSISYCWPLDLTLGDISGYTGYVAGGNGRTSTCQVYRINASSLGKWDADDTPVLTVGADGAWDDTGMTGLSIATLGGTRYMYYIGFGDWTQAGNYQLATHAFLGLATYDQDAGKWVREPDPLPLNMTPEGEVGGIEALTVGNRIHMWITDNYGDETAVGYFLYDPDRAAAEDNGDSGVAEE